MQATSTSNLHTTVKCKACGGESCHGNFVYDFVKRVAYGVCSRCRNPL